jgi:hypothetical protein
MSNLDSEDIPAGNVFHRSYGSILANLGAKMSSLGEVGVNFTPTSRRFFSA